MRLSTLCSLLVTSRRTASNGCLVICVIQMGHITQWRDLVQCGVAGLWINRVRSIVLAKVINGGLGKEGRDCFSLLQEVYGVCPTCKSFHHPGCVKCTEEAPCTASSQWPEGLRIRKLQSGLSGIHGLIIDIRKNYDKLIE